MSKKNKVQYSELTIEQQSFVDEFASQQKNVNPKYTSMDKLQFSLNKKRKRDGHLHFNNLTNYYDQGNNPYPTGYRYKKSNSDYKQEKEECFHHHGVNLATLLKDGIVQDNDDFTTKHRRLRWIEDDNKYKYIGHKGVTKPELGKELYSPLNYDEKVDTLYIMAGEWDWFKAYLDGLCCTSSLWGEGYVFGQFPITIEILKKFKKIVLVYDQDKDGKGQGFAANIMKELPKKLGSDTKILNIELPFSDGSQGKDYCDWRKHNSLEDFLKLKPKKKPPVITKPADKTSDEKTKTEAAPPAAPKSEEQPKEEFKPQFIEEQNQTYYLKVNKKKDEVTSEYILHANFVLRVTERRINDDGQVSYLLWLKNNIGEVKKVEVDQGHILSNPNKFAACIGDMGFFSLYNLNLATHTAFISRALTDYEVSNKEITQYIGAYKPGKYLYNNAIASKDGIQNLDKIIPPKTKLSLKMPNDLKSYWKKTIEQLNKIYGGETWKIIGFCAASIWAREVSQEYNYFPILKIGGSKGSGKSSLASLMTSFFGGRREPGLNPKNVHSTAKSIWRDAEKFNGMPITLNEYKGGNKENQLISQLYDREGYNRSKTTNDLQTHSTTVNATFIVISTREISGYESEAVTSRCVDINLKTNPENKKPYDLMKNDKFLSSFPVLALQLDIKKAFEDINGHVSANLDLDTRATENHAIFLAFYTAIMELVGESVDRVELGGKLDKTVKEKQTTTKRENYAVKFLELMMAEMSRNNSDIAFRLALIESDGLYFRRTSSILSILKNKSTGRDLPNITTITRELKEMELAYENSRVFAGDQSKCWFIERKKLIELDIEEPEKVTNRSGQDWNKPADIE